MPEVHIPLGLGVDESTATELLDPAKALVTLQNGYQEWRGGLTKPLGWSALTTSLLSGAISNCYSAFSTDGTYAVIDGHRLNTYSEAVSRYIQGDRVPECVPRRVRMPYPHMDPTTVQVPITCIYCNGYIVVAAFGTIAGTATVVASVIDATTLKPVSSAATVATSTGTAQIRLVAAGTKVILVYTSGAATIAAKYIDLASASTINTGWTGGTTLATDAVNGQPFDAAYDSISGKFMLAYCYNGAGPNYIHAVTCSSTFSGASASTAVGTGAATSSVGLFCDSAGLFWLSYDDGAGNVALKAIDSTMANVYTAATIITSAVTSVIQMHVVKSGATTGTLVVSNGNTLNHLYCRDFTVAAGAVTTSGALRTYFNVKGLSKPWTAGGRYYCQATPWASDVSLTTDPRCVIVDVGEASTTLRPVAHIAQGIFTKGFAYVPTTDVAQISSTQVAVVYWVKASSTACALEIAICDFAASNRWCQSRYGRLTALSGGAPGYFDGTVYREISFIPRPDQPQMSTTGTGISLTNGRKYVVIYEGIDNAGNVDWSACSDPTSLYGAGTVNKTIRATVNPLVITTKYDADAPNNKTRCVLYATLDSNNGVGPYYRVGYTENSTAAATLTIDDALGDASLALQPQLYKNPGVVGTPLDRQALPGGPHMFTHGDRLVALADDGESVFYTSPRVIGEAPWSSSFFQFPVPGTYPNTAGWSQDGRMVIANESELWVVDGDGPPENGGNGTEFSIPRRLPCDVGCIEPRSICTTVAGTFFQSRRGIELLNRGFGVEWVGEPVQTTLGTYPVITGAALDVEKGHVLFACNSSESSHQVSGGGIILVFDLTTKTWFIRDTTASGYQALWMSTVSSKPRAHWALTDGTVRRENLSSNGSAYLQDGATWRTMTVETASFKLSGLSTDVLVKKVQLLYRKHTDANLLVYYAVDDSSSFTLARTYTGAELNALTAPQVEVPIGNDNRVRNIRFKIVDATPTGTGTSVGTGQGYTLLGLTVVYDNLLEGGRRLASGAR